MSNFYLRVDPHVKKTNYKLMLSRIVQEFAQKNGKESVFMGYNQHLRLPTLISARMFYKMRNYFSRDRLQLELIKFVECVIF